MSNPENSAVPPFSRRRLLRGAVGVAAMAAAVAPAHAQLPREAAEADFTVKNGRVRQSVMGWCFNPMKAETLAMHAKQIEIGRASCRERVYSSV